MYDGLPLAWFSNVVKNTVFFTCYESLKWAHPGELSKTQQMGFGMASGMTTTLFLLPIQVVSTLKTVHSNRGNRMSTLQAFRLVLQERGIKGFYAGRP
jgi:hypothetical protein